MSYSLLSSQGRIRIQISWPNAFQTHLLLFHSVQQMVWGFSGKALCWAEQLTAKYQNLLSCAPHACLLRPATVEEEGSNNRLGGQAWPAFPHCSLDLPSHPSLTENVRFWCGLSFQNFLFFMYLIRTESSSYLDWIWTVRSEILLSSLQSLERKINLLNNAYH